MLRMLEKCGVGQKKKGVEVYPAGEGSEEEGEWGL